MSSRKTHEGAEAVYAAAQKWVDCALRADNSLFTPGTPIWTPEWLGVLRERFLDQPDVAGDDFMQKLERQLAGSPPEVYQLAAEALYVHFLMVWRTTMGGDAKETQVNEVLGWSKQDITIPDDLVAGLTPGIASSQAFNMFRPYHVGFLAEFAEQWKEQPTGEQQRLLDDPWAFKDFVTGLSFRSKLLRLYPNAHRVQREALYHLVFADDFESTVSVAQKSLIASTKAFAHFIREDTPDVDRKLAQVRRGLKNDLKKDFDFYDSDIRVQWDPAFDRWDEFVRLARGITPENSKEDLEPKLELTRRLQEVREAVLRERPDWQDLVKKRGIPSPVFPVISVFAQIQLRNWVDNSPGEALRALQTIWKEGPLSVSERISAFCEKLPKEVGGAGSRTTVASQFLMALDVEQYPPYKTQAFMKTYERTGYDLPAPGAGEVALYEHALGFLDRVIEEAKDRGLDLPNRLRAQSVLWILHWPREYGDGPPEDDDGMEQAYWRPAEPADLPALADELYLPVDFLEEIEILLEDKKQVIFQGPPGTGKTFVAQKLARHLAGSDERVTLVQLHPSYAYEDFVQGFRPTLEGGQPGFELRDGPLLRAAKRARSEPGEKHFLVVDEINRGAPAKVLGELYFLLEYRDEKVRLQYQRDDEEDFSLPPNLYFIGTMNTADRSIALVDLALRRRFYFVEFHPDDKPVKRVLRKWLEQEAPGMVWVADVVERANEVLETDRHAAIGPSYFMKPGLDGTAVRRIWKHSVLSYIEERLFGEGDRLGQFDLDRLRRETGHSAAQGQDVGPEGDEEDGTQ